MFKLFARQQPKLGYLPGVFAHRCMTPHYLRAFGSLLFMPVGPLIPGIRPGVKPPHARVTENAFREKHIPGKHVFFTQVKNLRNPTESHGNPRNPAMLDLVLRFSPGEKPTKTQTHKQTQTHDTHTQR